MRTTSMSWQQPPQASSSLVDAYHLKLKAPFTALVAGPTGCGKTIFVGRLLRHYRTMTTLSDEPLVVVYMYGQARPADYVPSPQLQIHWFHIKTAYDFDVSLIEQHRPHLCVFDDLMTVLGDSKLLTDIYTKMSHHANFSVIFILQNIFHRGSQMRSLSLNSHYLVLFKNFRDRSQVDNLARQVAPHNIAGFRRAFAEATREPFGYLLIDCKPDTPDELRFRSHLTPEEQIKGAEANAIFVHKV